MALCVEEVGGEGRLSFRRGEEVARGEETRFWARAEVEEEEGVGEGGEGGSSEGDLSSEGDCFLFGFLAFFGASTHVSCRSWRKHLNKNFNFGAFYSIFFLEKRAKGKGEGKGKRGKKDKKEG